jgi:hypothetical protein
MAGADVDNLTSKGATKVEKKIRFFKNLLDNDCFHLRQIDDTIVSSKCHFVFVYNGPEEYLDLCTKFDQAKLSYSLVHLPIAACFEWKANLHAEKLEKRAKEQEKRIEKQKKRIEKQKKLAKTQEKLAKTQEKLAKKQEKRAKKQEKRANDFEEKNVKLRCELEKLQQSHVTSKNYSLSL